MTDILFLFNSISAYDRVHLILRFTDKFMFVSVPKEVGIGSVYPKYISCKGKLFQRVPQSDNIKLVEVSGDVPIFSKVGYGQRRYVTYKGHRYRQATAPSRALARYVCDKWSSGCKAVIRAENEKIIEIMDKHNHSR